MTAKDIAWSHSALDAFETCPRRYYLTKIAKTVADPPNAEAQWGNRVHKALEERLLSNKPLPSGMDIYAPYAEDVLDTARRVGARVEAETKLTLTRSFRETSWFAKDAWVRCILDFVVTKKDKAVSGDWKTGKPKTDSAQLRLGAAALMHARPWINVVHNTFVWLKDGTTTDEVVTRDDLPAIWQEFLPRVERMEHARQTDDFPARPSGLCRSWCPVGKTNCEHCGS